MDVSFGHVGLPPCIRDIYLNAVFNLIKKITISGKQI